MKHSIYPGSQGYFIETEKRKKREGNTIYYIRYNGVYLYLIHSNMLHKRNINERLNYCYITLLFYRCALRFHPNSARA